jgi:hypothetical protein
VTLSHRSRSLTQRVSTLLGLRLNPRNPWLFSAAIVAAFVPIDAGDGAFYRDMRDIGANFFGTHVARVAEFVEADEVAGIMYIRVLSAARQMPDAYYGA